MMFGAVYQFLYNFIIREKIFFITLADIYDVPATINLRREKCNWFSHFTEDRDTSALINNVFSWVRRVAAITYCSVRQIYELFSVIYSCEYLRMIIYAWRRKHQSQASRLDTDAWLRFVKLPFYRLNRLANIEANANFLSNNGSREKLAEISLYLHCWKLFKSYLSDFHILPLPVRSLVSWLEDFKAF